jgi:hypothetical protein
VYSAARIRTVKYSLLSLVAIASLVPSSALAGGSSRPPSVNKVSIVAENPFQLRIETTGQIAPQAQMIEGPDRLIIDLPNTQPGVGLRRLNVNRGAVRAVRTSLYSRQPSVTRVVVDLTLPQWYRIVPDSSGVLVTIGGGAGAPTDPGTTIGWVSTKSPAHHVSSAKTTAVMPGARRSAPVNGVSVEFANGMLSIHANNASLSEVLFQIQKKTGAEIAIPAGTEQERVAADFGPGTPSDVLSQLLNGSGLNFVVVGSESDPNALRSVLLSPKGPDMPTPAQPYSPPVAQNMQMEAPDNVAVPGPEIQQQQQSMPEIVAPPTQQDPPPGT